MEVLSSSLSSEKGVTAYEQKRPNIQLKETHAERTLTVYEESMRHAEVAATAAGKRYKNLNVIILRAGSMRRHKPRTALPGLC